jgi:hypothetical protein
VHQQLVDLANKRINFLDYLRKACETPQLPLYLEMQG